MRVVFLGKGKHYGCTATVLPDLGQGLTKKGEVANSRGGGQGVGRNMCGERKVWRSLTIATALILLFPPFIRRKAVPYRR